MEAEINFSSIAPPVFDGNNYQIWAVRMETFLEALDLWKAVEEDYQIPPLPDNPTLAQIKAQKERKTKKSKAKACLFAAVSATIFARIMSLKSAKKIWDYLKSEYEGDERIRGMQVLNLIRNFELQRMKETETIKEYSERLLSIANQVRLLGSSMVDSRIVEKILVTVPERFEATITTLENTKDLSKITLAELLSALQAQEQRRMMRQEGAVEEALLVKHQDDGRNKKTQAASGESSAVGNKSKAGNKRAGVKGSYPPCHHCGKKGHPPYKCGRRPDAKCSICNQMGHEAVICENKDQQQGEEAKIADQEEEDLLFVATCFVGSESSESWLIDSGCTNHMTSEKELFRDLRPTNITKVRIGNGDYISVKGKGTIAIASYSDKYCLIKDAANHVIFKVKMEGKSFALNPLEEEQTAFQIEENITEVWHKRLGHCNHQRLLQMKFKSLANDLPEFEDHIPCCKACQFGKLNRKPFSKVTSRASRKPQLTHTDVSGPQRTPSLKELMLMGFISLLLTVTQNGMIKICVPVGWTHHMLPCSLKDKEKNGESKTPTSYFQTSFLFYDIFGTTRHLFVVIFLLLNVHGWNTYFWIAFVPVILLLAVGTKLEHVIIQLAHEVAEKHSAIEGELVYAAPKARRSVRKLL